LLTASFGVFAQAVSTGGNTTQAQTGGTAVTATTGSNSTSQAAVSGGANGNSVGSNLSSSLAITSNSPAVNLGNAVPNVSAPNLATTLTETCMGSTSAGAAAAGWGFSFGTTWRDHACVRRLDARQMTAFGDMATAREMMCDSDLVREAAKRVGRPCMEDGGVPYGTVAQAAPASREMEAPAPVVQQAPSEESAAAVVQQRVHE